MIDNKEAVVNSWLEYGLTSVEEIPLSKDFYQWCNGDRFEGVDAKCNNKATKRYRYLGKCFIYGEWVLQENPLMYRTCPEHDEFWQMVLRAQQ